MVDLFSLRCLDCSRVRFSGLRLTPTVPRISPPHPTFGEQCSPSLLQRRTPSRPPTRGELAPPPKCGGSTTSPHALAVVGGPVPASGRSCAGRPAARGSCGTRRRAGAGGRGLCEGGAGGRGGGGGHLRVDEGRPPPCRFSSRVHLIIPGVFLFLHFRMIF